MATPKATPTATSSMATPIETPIAIDSGSSNLLDIVDKSTARPETFRAPWNTVPMMWWVVMVAIGVWMAISGFTKFNAIPFRYLVARASVLWKSLAHTFLGVSGVIVALVGAFYLTAS